MRISDERLNILRQSSQRFGTGLRNTGSSNQRSKSRVPTARLNSLVESNVGAHWRCRLPRPPGRQHVQELFQGNFAHGLVAHDLADFQAFDRQLALLVFTADHFGADRICFVAQAI